MTTRNSVAWRGLGAGNGSRSLPVTIGATVVWCEAEESRANAAGKKLQEAGNGVANMYVVNDKGPQRLYCAVLEIQ